MPGVQGWKAVSTKSMPFSMNRKDDRLSKRCVGHRGNYHGEIWYVQAASHISWNSSIDSYSGAKAVLMSLWSVEDESTNLLTERFFTHLKAGKDRLNALRQARSELRKAGYRHPFFWAGFILVGEK